MAKASPPIRFLEGGKSRRWVDAPADERSPQEYYLDNLPALGKRKQDGQDKAVDEEAHDHTPHCLPIQHNYLTLRFWIILTFLPCPLLLYSHREDNAPYNT